MCLQPAHEGAECLVTMVGWLGFNGTFSTNRLYHGIEVGNISHWAGENTKQLNNERIQ